MNCFRTKSKAGKESKNSSGGSGSSANGETGKQPNISSSSSGRSRLYKKKSERSNNGSVTASGETKHNIKMDGHGHSKKTDISGASKSEKTSSFCWKQTSENNGNTVEIYGTTLETVAYMPVSKNAPFYNMNHPRRGRAVIFNFDHWDNTLIPDLGLSPRKGSQKDKEDLSQCLEDLDFEVTTHDNCGNLEMWRILKKLRREDHSDADCLFVAFFTHGEKNTVFVRDGSQIPVNLIWEFFEADHCPSLAGKPKIFIVQACRGNKYDNGTTLSPGARPSDLERPNVDVTDSATFSYVIPNAADIIVAFSCPLGHYSWRNPESGSWFIQSICKVFNEHAYDMDLQNLFTTVAREVALNFESNRPHEWEAHKKKQVTSTCSTLIRNVQFRPKGRNLNAGDNSNVATLEMAMSSIHVTTDENKAEIVKEEASTLYKLIPDQDQEMDVKDQKDAEEESSTDSSTNTNL